MVYNGDDGETVHVCVFVNLAVFNIDGVYFRIHHPFLLSDNRHYTFYVWRRVYMVHPMMPYVFILHVHGRGGCVSVCANHIK